MLNISKREYPLVGINIKEYFSLISELKYLNNWKSCI